MLSINDLAQGYLMLSEPAPWQRNAARNGILSPAKIQQS